jgi:hypothetical protein
MTRLFAKHLLALSALALGGCQTAPLSFLDGKPLTRIDTSLYAVTVVSVDGTIQFHNPVQVAPGLRRLTLEAAPASGARRSVQKAVDFKVEPCTWYYLAAQRSSPMAADWTLVVDSKETVAGCKPELELSKAGASPR